MIRFNFLEQAIQRGRARFFGPDVNCDLHGFDLTVKPRGQSYMVFVRATGEHSRYPAMRQPLRIGVSAFEDGDRFLSFEMSEKLGGAYYATLGVRVMGADGQVRTREIHRFNSSLPQWGAEPNRCTAH